MLKICGKSIIKSLLIIYEKYLEKGCFLNEWKKAIVATVHSYKKQLKISTDISIVNLQ